MGKSIFLGLVISLSAALSFAKQAPQLWQIELDQYRTEIKTISTASLTLRLGMHGGKALAACSADVLILGSTVIADTLPVAGVLSETVANLVDDKYETTNAEFSLTWHNIKDVTGDLIRGGSGGGAVLLGESVPALFYWLAGESDKSFDSFAKIYESSMTTVNKLFANQAPCYMSYAKTLLLFKELQTRQSTEDWLTYGAQGAIY